VSESRLRIRKIAVSAVFLSFALVCKYFAFDVPLFGAAGLRIGYSGIFSCMPALLFGPLFGAVTEALTDFLGFFIIRSGGSYMPLLTVTAAIGGFLRAVLWMALKKQKSANIRAVIVVMAILTLAGGLLNIYALKADGVTNSLYDDSGVGEINTQNKRYISRLLIEGSATRKDPAGTLSFYITMMTVGLIGFSVCCTILLAADLSLSKKLEQKYGKLNLVKILTVMLIAGLLVNTLNTVVLREVLYPSWKLFPFAAAWLPRAAEEIVSVTIYSYFIAVLYGLYIKYFSSSNLS